MRLILSTMLLMVASIAWLISGAAVGGSQAPTASVAGCATDGDPQVTTDKMAYDPGETVGITGAGFSCGAALTITVTWPARDADSRVDSAQVVADEAGQITHRYELPLNALPGAYTVSVLDDGGNVLASTVFFDSHFRYGHITWTHVSGDTVDLTITLAFRRTFSFGCQNANIGDVCSLGTSGQLNFGDGIGVTPNYTIFAISADEDWLLGTATVQHTYSSSGTFIAFNGDCCRIGSPRHINNPDLSWRVEAIVDLQGGNTGNPRSNLSPIVECSINALCRFQIPVIEPDGQPVKFSLSGPGVSGGIVQPPGASIDPNSGLYS